MTSDYISMEIYYVKHGQPHMFSKQKPNPKRVTMYTRLLSFPLRLRHQYKVFPILKRFKPKIQKPMSPQFIIIPLKNFIMEPTKAKK